jgi:hypothetical protein
MARRTPISREDQPTLDAIQRMPPEEHILWCAEVAKKYLDMGWTSCVGAAAKPRSTSSERDQRRHHRRPRYLAASRNTVPGGLGDTTRRTCRSRLRVRRDRRRRGDAQACACSSSGASTCSRSSGESITGMPSDAASSPTQIAVCVEAGSASGRGACALVQLDQALRHARHR